LKNEQLFPVPAGKQTTTHTKNFNRFYNIYSIANMEMNVDAAAAAAKEEEENNNNNHHEKATSSSSSTTSFRAGEMTTKASQQQQRQQQQQLIIPKAKWPESLPHPAEEHFLSIVCQPDWLWWVLHEKVSMMITREGEGRSGESSDTFFRMSTLWKYVLFIDQQCYSIQLISLHTLCLYLSYQLLFSTCVRECETTLCFCINK